MNDKEVMQQIVDVFKYDIKRCNEDLSILFRGMMISYLDAMAKSEDISLRLIYAMLFTMIFKAVAAGAPLDPEIIFARIDHNIETELWPVIKAVYNKREKEKQST